MEGKSGRKRQKRGLGRREGGGRREGIEIMEKNGEKRKWLQCRKQIFPLSTFFFFLFHFFGLGRLFPQGFLKYTFSCVSFLKLPIFSLCSFFKYSSGGGLYGIEYRVLGFPSSSSSTSFSLLFSYSFSLSYS